MKIGEGWLKQSSSGPQLGSSGSAATLSVIKKVCVCVALISCDDGWLAAARGGGELPSAEEPQRVCEYYWRSLMEAALFRCSCFGQQFGGDVLTVWRYISHFADFSQRICFFPSALWTNVLDDDTDM